MARYLIVANQTLGGEQLTGKLDELISAGPCTLRFLVPVTDTESLHQRDYPEALQIAAALAQGRLELAHQIAAALAQGRLEHELTRLRRSGIEASGEVADALPTGRAQELLHAEHFDGVIVSTLPRRLSRWMVMDLPHRIARLSDVPMTHVEGNAGPSL